MTRRLTILFLIATILLSMCACSSTSKETQQAEQNESSSPIATLADAEQYYGTTFGQGDIIDINVEISDDDWQDIKDNAIDEEYHTANITVNGTTVTNVGFRTKGGSSLISVANSDSDRFGFKIKLDEYVDDQTLNGLDALVLNGDFSDSSYMREYLTYSASAYLGCDTPDVAYCNLSINGELFGFYLCIESYDDSFVERNTDSADTVLYKAESENCTLLTSDDGTGFDIQYGEDEDYSNIKNLITVLNNTTSENKDELESILDIDSVLKAIAINTVMGNYDSYSGSKAHNYYLMYSDGKFSYIGWDYNMSIGGFMDSGASVSADISSPVYGVDISQRPLIQKLLAIDEYNQRYLGYVDSLTEYFSDFEIKVDAIADTIRDNVKNDPSAFYTIDQFETSIKLSDTDLSQAKSTTQGGNNQGANMQWPYGEAPAVPSGEIPTRPYGNNQTWPSGGTQNAQYGTGQNMQHQNGGGGGMSLNSDPVSIVDYITQRIQNIQSQEAGNA